MLKSQLSTLAGDRNIFEESSKELSAKWKEIDSQFKAILVGFNRELMIVAQMDFDTPSISSDVIFNATQFFVSQNSTDPEPATFLQKVLT